MRAKAITYKVASNGECWECDSHAVDRHGYPKITRNKRGYTMSRYVYEQSFGPIPKGLEVRHKCDNPPCIRLDHLELGTHGDNMRDLAIRGRRRAPDFSGSKNPFATLTESLVREIRAQLAEGRSQTDVARDFGVHQTTISRIYLGQRWKEVS